MLYLYILLTKILLAVKEKPQEYCPTVYSRSGSNQMILQNKKRTSKKHNSQNCTKVNSIKQYDFSTLYTIISCDKLNYSLFDIIDSRFLKRNGSRKLTYLVIGHLQKYYVKNQSNCAKQVH